MGRRGLRQVSATALVMLVLQYGLGMILNFYVGIPAADAHAGIVTEITTAPLALTAHALLGVCLVGTAILAVAKAMAMRDRFLAALAAAGLAAIVGAFIAGEMFVKNGQDSTSFAMAVLTGAALLSYIVLLVLASGTRQALDQQTEPLLVSVPAARSGDLEDDPEGWGAEPGWDDDPDWAQRLRQDAEPGWPGRPAVSQRPAVRPEQRADWAQRPPVRPPYRVGQAQHSQPQQRQAQHSQPQHSQPQHSQPQHSQPQRPQAWGPQAQRPQAWGPQAQRPQAQGPQAWGPQPPQSPQPQSPQPQGPPDWWGGA
jgi:hypothetical protein